MAVASLVLGIVSLVFLFIPGVNFIGIITAIVGIILGAMARKKMDQQKGMATAGLVCSIIALAACTIVWIACIACASAVGAAALR